MAPMVFEVTKPKMIRTDEAVLPAQVLFTACCSGPYHTAWSFDEFIGFCGFPAVFLSLNSPDKAAIPKIADRFIAASPFF
jgi:hypothetical protein